MSTKVLYDILLNSSSRASEQPSTLPWAQPSSQNVLPSHKLSRTLLDTFLDIFCKCAHLNNQPMLHLAHITSNAHPILSHSHTQTSLWLWECTHASYCQHHGKGESDHQQYFGHQQQLFEKQFECGVNIRLGLGCLVFFDVKNPFILSYTTSIHTPHECTPYTQ